MFETNQLLTNSLTELKLWSRQLTLFKKSNINPKTRIEGLKLYNVDIYYIPQYTFLFKIVFTHPVYTLTPERTFSNLKRIKSYLRIV